MPNPEVIPIASRRQYTAQYKLRILEEADRCTKSGELGALLRREGIYSSYLSRWRQAREQGKLAALNSKKRGPKPSVDSEAEEENARLRRENERLQTRLAQAETIIDVQKKLSELLGINLGENRSNVQE
ncbi:MAG: transposase [Proteobacteria bacterium]|nr:transposase [Pseudomonadota bacterium]